MSVINTTSASSAPALVISSPSNPSTKYSLPEGKEFYQGLSQLVAKYAPHATLKEVKISFSASNNTVSLYTKNPDGTTTPCAEPLDLNQLATTDPQFYELISSIKNQANKILTPPTSSATPPSDSPTPSVESTKKTPEPEQRPATPATSASSASAGTEPSFLPHGIQNGSLRCYANAAYQLLANIPSLNRTVLQQLPPSLERLKDYPTIKSGADLVDTWNTAYPTNTFTPGPHEAGEFLSRLISTVDNYPTAAVEISSKRKLPENDPSHTVHEPARPQFYTGLDTSAPGKTIDFNEALTAGLHSDNLPEEVTEGDVLSSVSRFKGPISQMFIKIDRFKGGRSDTRAVVNIPNILSTALLKAQDSPSENLVLQGFIVYTPGHYFSYFKKENPDHRGTYDWWMTNDSTCKKVSNTDVEAILQGKSSKGCVTDLYYDSEPQLTPYQESASRAPGFLSRLFNKKS